MIGPEPTLNTGRSSAQRRRQSDYSSMVHHQENAIVRD